MTKVCDVWASGGTRSNPDLVMIGHTITQVVGNSRLIHNVREMRIERPRTESSYLLMTASDNGPLAFKQLPISNLPSVASESSCRLYPLVMPSPGTNISIISPDSFSDTFKMLKFSQGTYTMRLIIVDN